MPSHSCSPRCWPRITRPASAAARGGSSRVREPASATPSGRRRSGVTARPRPIGSTGVYRLRFITAKTSPSWSVGTLQLGLVFAVMNLSLYTAVDRIGLGLAVTLEFLGPLGVALAGSRTRLDLLCAAGACFGVYILVLPGPTSDYPGLGLALLAAVCWAAYILLNRLLGTRLPGLQAPAAATSVSALLYLPVAPVLIAQGRLHGTAVLYAIGAGVFSSVVPYAADLISL